MDMNIYIYIHIYGGFRDMQDWENLALEAAVAAGDTVFEYVWGWKHAGEEVFHTYRLDLVQMTQTNTDNGVVRDLLRIESPASTSPYHGALDGNKRSRVD